MTMTGRLYYLTEFSDEVIPCAPSLDAWAAWLKSEQFVDGQVFAAFTIDLLGEVEVRRVIAPDQAGDGWRLLAGEVPDGSTFFYVRHGSDMGWSAEHSGSTIFQALQDVEDEDPVFIACVRDGPKLTLAYDASGPTLTIRGQVN